MNRISNMVETTKEGVVNFVTSLAQEDDRYKELLVNIQYSIFDDEQAQKWLAAWSGNPNTIEEDTARFIREMYAEVESWAFVKEDVSFYKKDRRSWVNSFLNGEQFNL